MIEEMTDREKWCEALTLLLLDLIASAMICGAIVFFQWLWGVWVGWHTPAW
jgi:uncharacterized membrane protein